MSYPLPTLAPTISASGITAPTYNDILQSLIATYQSIYGSDVLLTPDTQDYQFLAALALAQQNTNDAIVAAYQGFAPTFAQGAGLSALVKINGIARLVPSNSTATVTIVGTAGTVVNNGIVQDANGNLWNLPATVTVPNTGTIDVTATCQTAGAVTASSGTITGIYTPTYGWQSVTNAASATAGAPVETDAALRARQAASTALPAVTPLQSIAAAIANLAGVTRSLAYENQTAITDGNSVPGHSIDVIVEGGTLTAIAQTIEATKAPGTGTYGATQIIVDDPEGLPILISFDQLTNTQIYVTVVTNHLSGRVSSTTTLIQAAPVAFPNSLTIGEEVRYTQIFAVAQLVGLPQGQTFTLTTVHLGTAPAPGGTSDVPVAFNAAAAAILANMVVS